MKHRHVDFGDIPVSETDMSPTQLDMCPWALGNVAVVRQTLLLHLLLLFRKVPGWPVVHSSPTYIVLNPMWSSLSASQDLDFWFLVRSLDLVSDFPPFSFPSLDLSLGFFSSALGHPGIWSRKVTPPGLRLGVALAFPVWIHVHGRTKIVSFSFIRKSLPVQLSKIIGMAHTGWF